MLHVRPRHLRDLRQLRAKVVPSKLRVEGCPGGAGSGPAGGKLGVLKGLLHLGHHLLLLAQLPAEERDGVVLDQLLCLVLLVLHLQLPHGLAHAVLLHQHLLQRFARVARLHLRAHGVGLLLADDVDVAEPPVHHVDLDEVVGRLVALDALDNLGNLLSLGEVNEAVDGVRVAVLDEGEVGEVDAEVGNDRRRRLAQEIPVDLVVALVVQLRLKLTDCLQVRLIQLCPCALQPPHRTVVDARDYLHHSVEVVQLAQARSDADELAEDFHALLEAHLLDHLGDDPVAGEVEARDHAQDVGRQLLLVLGAPALVEALFRRNRTVELRLDHCQLPRDLLRVQQLEADGVLGEPGGDPRLRGSFAAYVRLANEGRDVALVVHHAVEGIQ
mmetsp:Transcript_11980/g.48280  ORF Transcript_11980/g.48280 Transcript_11980/m.48280 type:complete len:385 (+) Transcript_11980:1140-2294(+)